MFTNAAYSDGAFYDVISKHQNGTAANFRVKVPKVMDSLKGSQIDNTFPQCLKVEAVGASMKKFLVVKEVRPDIFEKKINDILEEDKYEMVNSGADGALGYWAYLVLKM